MNGQVVSISAPDAEAVALESLPTEESSSSSSGDASRGPERQGEEEEEEEEAAAEDNVEEEEEEESSDDSGPPKVPEVVGGRFRVKRRIGSGSYSEVYMATDTVTLDKVAIKAEWKGALKTNKLQGEAQLYQKLGSSDVAPSIHWFGTQGEYCLMVMDLLGPSLDSLLKERGKFSLRTTLLLADQMLDRLQFVHDRGIVYRDIKPHNFLLGRSENKDRIYIVDFGLSKKYWSSREDKHLQMKKHSGFVGTVRYCSIRSHQGYDASRRDDLEALGYVWLHFLRGKLPWQGIKAKSKRKKHALIERKKLESLDEELCRGFPKEFTDYFKYCRGLAFEARPDYAMLRARFREAFVASGFDKAGWQVDWDDMENEMTLASKVPGRAGGAEGRSRSGTRKKGRSPARQAVNGRPC